MPPNVAYILLDTMIVLGVYALPKPGQTQLPDEKEWRTALNNILQKIPAVSLYKLTIPTPVCYELLCHGPGWSNYILQNEDEMFRFAKADIKNNILQKAAKYTLDVDPINPDGHDGKMRTMDPLIAAYALQFDYYLLTENQQDYPEPYFSVIATEPLVLKNKSGKHYRRLLHLLKPNLESSI